MSDNAPTPAEVERVKRWASMQSPKVTVEQSNMGGDVWFIKADPPMWLRVDWIHDDEYAAWSALALALRPVFASIAPVVRDECIQVLRRTPCFSAGAVPSITHAINEIENLK